LTESAQVKRFQAMVLPHLNAAYRLACWLIRDEHVAQDLVQEAYLSAFKAFTGFHGEDGRAWILTIVRNACYRWLRRNQRQPAVEEFDETRHSPDEAAAPAESAADNPESWLLREESQRQVRQALERLPPEFKEIIVLRELEGCSYREIAGIANVPLGTVMSRLARARKLLCNYLADLNEDA
jgi:RNA polymerase sigma factor (sigma-70 family)